jgi:hypothetical protein
MKKHLSLLATLLLIALCGISQTFEDSTKVANKHLLKAIALIEKGKVDEQQIELNKELINKMDKSISNKDSIIKIQSKRIENSDLINLNLQSSVGNWEAISLNYQANYKSQLKITRRTKAKAYVFLVLGFFLSYVIYK